MSTLGRKAIRKTLERLKKEAFRNTDDCVKMFGELRKEGEDEMDRGEQRLLDLVSDYLYDAIRSLLRYIQALQDYSLELDETWNNLLKTVEQAKPAQKKEEAKKTSYIK